LWEDKPVTLWYYAWMAIFAGSTAAFAMIAIIVVALGAVDLKAMLQRLS